MTARVVLGADAWAVLRRDAAGLRLPPAFDAPLLTAGQAGAAEAAVRGAGLVSGDGDLVAGLHPSVRASLLLQLTAPAVVDVAVGRGDDVTTVRVAVGAGLASSLSRRGGGPVVLETLRSDDVAAHVAGLLPGLPERAEDAPPLVLDAVGAVAAESVRADGPRLAAALHPPPVVELGARLEVRGPHTALVLLAVRTGDGWAAGRLDGGDLVLRPLDADALVTDLAGALAAALVPALVPS